MDKWMVNIFGEPGKIYEISVVKVSNQHGRVSFGWPGDDKIIISGSGGPCAYRISKRPFELLVAAAHTYAAELNEESE